MTADNTPQLPASQAADSGEIASLKESISMAYRYHNEDSGMSFEEADADLDRVIAAAVQADRKAIFDKAIELVAKQRPIFLTNDDVNPFGDDPMAEKAVAIRDQLRREIIADLESDKQQEAAQPLTSREEDDDDDYTEQHYREDNDNNAWKAD